MCEREKVYAACRPRGSRADCRQPGTSRCAELRPFPAIFRAIEVRFLCPSDLLVALPGNSPGQLRIMPQKLAKHQCSCGFGCNHPLSKIPVEMANFKPEKWLYRDTP